MSLIRLIYRSRNAMSVGGSRVFVHYNDIVTTARRNNAKYDITGFLMFDHERYHQILEGESRSIDYLYDRIQRDLRHTDVETLSRDAISSRGFPDWSMGSFLNEGRPHPLREKHGIAPKTALEAQRFLTFALDFVAEEPTAA